MKYIRLIILVISVSLFSCESDNLEGVTYYYKAVNEGKIVSYQKIDYTYDLDSINERITIYDLKGDVIQKQKNNFIKSENGLNIIVNKNKEQYLQLKKKNDCVIYRHPVGYDVKNCFLGQIDYREYKNAIKFSYSEEVIDGLNMVIYLDNNYSLIDKKEIIGSGSYEELIRIDKASLPKEISNKM